MEDHEEVVWTRLDQLPAQRHGGRRWLLIGGLALAFMLALGVGVLIGSSPSAAQAAILTTGSTSSPQSLAAAQGNANSTQPLVVAQGTQGTRGQCESLMVSSVSGNTIVAKTASGRSVTVHTTASTRYTQAGKTVAASAIKVGTRINVMGTHNSDGSITATSIDIG
jgi:Domain of unknown function (DUF5666)